MAKVTVTRNVAIDEDHNYADRGVAKGETFYVFEDGTFGAVNDRGGIALSEYGPLEYPFFEFPANAIERMAE